MTPLGDTLVHIDISMNDIVKSEKIIYASEPSYEFTYLFSIFIDQLFNKKVQNNHVDALVLTSLIRKDVDTAVENMSNFYTMFEETINYGRVVKYFDYNFNYNSFALLGKFFKNTQKRFNNENIHSDENVFFSKYMVQLLYFINKEMLAGIEPKTESVLINNMHHWKGTGKYSIRADLGSSVSRVTILENLKNLNLICTEKSSSTNKRIYLSDQGKHFLNILPKDCQDQDLPFRIKLWAEKPFEQSKFPIDTYLNNYFKKIKNKINIFEK